MMFVGKHMKLITRQNYFGLPLWTLSKDPYVWFLLDWQCKHCEYQMKRMNISYIHLNQKHWRSCPWYVPSIYLKLLSIISFTRKFMVKSILALLTLLNTSRMLPTDVCPLRVFRIFCTLSSDRDPSSMLQCIHNTALQTLHFNYDVA